MSFAETTASVGCFAVALTPAKIRGSTTTHHGLTLSGIFDGAVVKCDWLCEKDCSRASRLQFGVGVPNNGCNLYLIHFLTPIYISLYSVMFIYVLLRWL
mgnify:CR=1 FL=1